MDRQGCIAFEELMIYDVKSSRWRLPKPLKKREPTSMRT